MAKFVLVVGLLTTVFGVSNIVLSGGAEAVDKPEQMNPKHINSGEFLGERIKLGVPEGMQHDQAELLDHGDIVGMLAKLQVFELSIHL